MARRRSKLQAAEDFLVAVTAILPFVVALRYRWAQPLLPIAIIPLVMLAVHSPQARSAMVRIWTDLSRSRVGLWAFLLALWMLASPLWGPDPEAAFRRAFRAAGLVVIAITLAGALTTVPRARMFPQLIAATLAAIGLAGFNIISNGLAHRAMGCCREGMQADFTGAAITITLVLWPCAGWLLGTGRRTWGWALVGLGTVLVFTSHSGASGLALTASLLTIAVGAWRTRAAVVIPLLLMLAGFAIAPWLGDLGRLPPSINLLGRLADFHASERVQIWSYYTDLLWQRPWTGYGFDAEHVLGDPHHSAAYSPTIPPMFATFHAHNMALQMLVEFGAIGAALTLVAAAVAAATAQNDSRLPILIAPLSAVAAAALVNFGLWEEWLINVVLITLVFSLRLRQPDPVPPDAPDDGARSARLTRPG